MAYNADQPRDDHGRWGSGGGGGNTSRSIANAKESAAAQDRARVAGNADAARAEREGRYGGRAGYTPEAAPARPTGFTDILGVSWSGSPQAGQIASQIHYGDAERHADATSVDARPAGSMGVSGPSGAARTALEDRAEAGAQNAREGGTSAERRAAEGN